MHFVSVHVMHPNSSVDTATVWKKYRFILSNRSDFHMINNQLILFNVFAKHILTSLSLDEMLLPKYVSILLILEAFHLEWR